MEGAARETLSLLWRRAGISRIHPSFSCPPVQDKALLSACEGKRRVLRANLRACEQTTILFPAQTPWWSGKRNLSPPVARASKRRSQGVLDLSSATRGWIIPLDPLPHSAAGRRSLFSLPKTSPPHRPPRKSALPFFFSPVFFFFALKQQAHKPPSALHITSNS